MSNALSSLTNLTARGLVVAFALVWRGAMARLLKLSESPIDPPNPAPKAGFSCLCQARSSHAVQRPTCVARAGVTGADRELALDHGRLFAALAEAGAPPLVLGFGIASPEHVRQALAHGAAGVISGSALVELVARRESPAELAHFEASLKAATAGQRLDFALAAQ